jgi:hypothetical protein
MGMGCRLGLGAVVAPWIVIKKSSARSSYLPILIVSNPLFLMFVF